MEHLDVAEQLDDALKQRLLLQPTPEHLVNLHNKTLLRPTDLLLVALKFLLLVALNYCRNQITAATIRKIRYLLLHQ